MSPAPPTSPLFPYTTLFRSQYIPVTNEAIAVRYRDRGRAIARINDPASIAAHASGSDDGAHAIVAARGVGGNAGRIVDARNGAAAIAVADRDSFVGHGNVLRSEERRVGKEGRCRGGGGHGKEKS